MTIVLNLGIKRTVERVLQIVDAAFFGIILFLQRWVSIRTNTILLLRQDAIGDYILFRNFISVLKTSELYNGYNITLCGNILWRELSETLDCDDINDFIWLDKTKFQLSRPYKYLSLLKICTKGYSILIHPTYSRNAYTDTLVHFIKAERKIGSEGELKVFIKWKGILIDQVYDQLVEADNEPMFEFLRNKNFIENIIDAPIVLERPRIDVTRIHIQRQISKPYAIIAPGASEATKMWPIKRFCELTAHLQNKYDLTIVVTGSKEEGKLADEILSYIKDNKALNLAGKVNLSGLAKIISECVILISNDTGTIHIGAAVDAKTVCITNGNRFGRFVPYPANIANNLCCVFPDEIYSPSIKIHNFTEMYRDRPISDITSVHFNMVKQTIDRILGV